MADDGFSFAGGMRAHLGGGEASRAAALGLALGAMMLAAAPAAAEGPRHVEVAGFEQATPQQRAFAAALEQGALGGIAARSCLKGRIAHPKADLITESTVYLVALDGAGKPLASGSGVVVADSADPGGGPNKLLTARHLAENEFYRAKGVTEAHRFLVYSSDGGMLGVAATTAKGGGGGPMDPRDSTSDTAVLRMTGHHDMEALRRFAGIRGLPLAPRQTGTALTGYVTGPIGIWHGNSGGPAVDAEAAIMGVVSSVLDEGLRFKSMTGPNIEKTIDAGKVRQGKSRLPTATTANIAPVSDPAVLAALGRAGQAVQVGDPVVLRPRADPRTGAIRTVAEPAPFDLTTAGFPDHMCVGTTAVYRPQPRTEEVAARPMAAPKDGASPSHDPARRAERMRALAQSAGTPKPTRAPRSGDDR